ncbi:MAG: hypothetical protein ACRYGF_10725 [Janthinobacterium lividum]
MSAYALTAASEDPMLRSEFKLVRRMEGSAQSLLVRDTSDQLWILKLRSDLQGSNALANDFVGTFLIRAMGLPSPDFKIAEISGNFFKDPDTWFMSASGRRERPEGGLHFASRFFPESNDTVTIPSLPPNLHLSPESRRFCLGMFLFDVWSDHADRRQSLFFVRDHQMHVTFIDNSHLFGGPDWSSLRYSHCTSEKPLERFAVEEYGNVDAMGYWMGQMEARIPSALAAALPLIPQGWYSGSVSAFHSKYLERLKKLRSFAVVAVASVLFNAERTKADEKKAAKLPISALTKDGEERWFYPYHAHLWELANKAELPDWHGRCLYPPAIAGLCS